MAAPANRKLIAVLAVMVAMPVAALGLLGEQVVRDRARLVEVQVVEALVDGLRSVSALVAGRLADKERALRDATASLPPGSDPAALRTALGQRPDVGRALVVDREGQVLFPPLDGDTSAQERAFLARTRTVWEGLVLPTLATAASGGETGAPAGPGVAATVHGWHAFYHGEGLQLLHWTATPERIVALELPRVELLADLVAALPPTDDEGGRTAILDAAGAVVYQWGTHEPPPGEPPAATLSLEAPLGSWRLARWTSATPADLLGAGLRPYRWLGLGAVALALLGLAVLLYRERTREMRLAAQRVSFVSQVSHELKTPLTNIRLYAELLDDELEGLGDGLDARAGRHLGVIVSESQRLSRLIGNVLTFARGQERPLDLRPAPVVLDRIVEEAVAVFAPSLAARGVAVTVEAAAPDRVLADGDAVGQVLANLLSNVEKYASADGGAVVIRTARQGDVATVTVTDGGPGVAPRDRERVFDAFYRASDRLTDGVAGTGIGLDIARRLARLHGGDLRLVPTDRGACFELTLHAPTAPPEVP